MVSYAVWAFTLCQFICGNFLLRGRARNISKLALNIRRLCAQWCVIVDEIFWVRVDLDFVHGAASAVGVRLCGGDPPRPSVFKTFGRRVFVQSGNAFVLHDFVNVSSDLVGMLPVHPVLVHTLPNLGLERGGNLEKLIGPVKVMLDAYANGELSAVYLCYNKFISTMAQQPTIDQLLPLSADKMEAETKAAGGNHGWDYLYEPDAQAVIDDLLVRYAEALVYQAVAENMASEHAARMVAMKAATDNAGNVIGELKLVYNKTRQAAITKELSEIVSGAAAISG